MAGRPRKRENRHFPDYLYFDKETGQYRFQLITGKRKSIGSDRAMAIAIAREYNLRMRPDMVPSIESLVRESGGINGEAKPFAEHAQALLDRAIRDENPGTDAKAVWLNDIERVKEFFSDIYACDIDLEHVNAYIKKYHSEASANVQNRKVSFLKKLFSYAVDESLMMDNPAERKKMRRVDSKARRRLTLADFNKIHRAAPLWLQTAMDLAMQTTHARLEVSRIRYSIKQPGQGICGCVWFSEPQGDIYGTLYIHRQKVQHKEASHVAIPIGPVLRDIIERSRDNVASPYVVHRLPLKRSNPTSKEVRHPTQVAPDYLSRSFSAMRDQVGVGAGMPEDQRPTFHEIRALSAFLFNKQGIDPQGRMAHSDAKSTKIYTENHIDWVCVPHGEIKTAS